MMSDSEKLDKILNLISDQRSEIKILRIEMDQRLTHLEDKVDKIATAEDGLNKLLTQVEKLANTLVAVKEQNMELASIVEAQTIKLFSVDSSEIPKFPASTLQQVIKLFKQWSKHGQLSKEKFAEIFELFWCESYDSKKMAHRIFKHMTSNLKSTINLYECLFALANNFKGPVDSQKIRWIFQLCRLNCSERISRHEITQFNEDLFELLWQTSGHEANLVGALSAQKKEAWITQRTEICFQMFGGWQKRDLSFDEFSKAVEANNSLVTWLLCDPNKMAQLVETSKRHNW